MWGVNRECPGLEKSSRSNTTWYLEYGGKYQQNQPQMFQGVTSEEEVGGGGGGG